jgi:hypothetical protein
MFGAASTLVTVRHLFIILEVLPLFCSVLSFSFLQITSVCTSY